MKKLISISLMALMAQAASAAVLLQYDFDDAVGTAIGPGFGYTQPTVGTGTWGFAINTSTTNGSGQLVSTATFSTTTGIGIAPIHANSGTYELAYNGVSFDNLGANDFISFGFFSSISGSAIGPGGSSSTRSYVKFGEFDGAAGLDVTYGINNAAGGNTAANIGSLASTYDFIISLDTNSKEASFFYDSGSGRVQIGSTLTGISIGTNDSGTGATADASYRGVAMRGTLTEGAAISIDQITYQSVVPEPSTYALIGGLLVLGFAFIKRRR